jgi:uncharacterized membrane protein
VNSLLSGLLSTGPSGNLTIKVAGIDLGGLANGLINALAAILAPLTAAVDLLLDALLQLLGIQVGTASVQMQSVLIGQPVIVSTALPAAGS